MSAVSEAATVPSWDEITVPVLSVLSDGELRRAREIKKETARAMGLTAEQRAVLMSSGQPMFDNRFGWAVHYLMTRAGALERPQRGHYRITPVGRELLRTHPDGLTLRDLTALSPQRAQERFDPGAGSLPEAVVPETGARRAQGAGCSAGSPARAGGAVPPGAEEASPERLSPEDQIQQGYQSLREEVSAALLTRLRDQDPAFFEQAVLDLLLAMGYGGAEGRAARTRLSRDGGIDGVIDQDPLGLSRVYVQAKRYAPGVSVQRPEVQAFAGALHGVQASRGVFLTTSTFSSGARDYVERLSSRVVLVDGARLAGLMIRYRVGVQVTSTVEVIRVDEDFFEDTG